MLYHAYEASSLTMGATRAAASFAGGLLSSWAPTTPLTDRVAAALELASQTRLSHARPEFGIEEVQVGRRTVAVREEVVTSTPFGSLLHFVKDPGRGADPSEGQPRVLLVAPMSGHFATLLRETVRTMLADHDVYITDWHNARDIPVSAGRFGFDDFNEHLIGFMEELGPHGHMMAVCQPCPSALVAVAVMAAEKNPATPRTLVLMAGPVDARVSPTAVNDLATSTPFSVFEQNYIARVPFGRPGAGRRVYPGFLQLSAFMSMNPGRHAEAHFDLYRALVDDDEQTAAATRAFYDEYFAVMDMTAEFYLETVDRVFQRHLLAEGEMEMRGKRVDPAGITRTALLTIEGERDDVCGIGQTMSAHDLCTGIPKGRRHHHLQPDVGHYGVFSGRRWRSQVYPVVRQHLVAHT